MFLFLVTSVGSRSTFYVGGGVSSTGSFHSRPQSGGETTEHRPPVPIPRSGSASYFRPPMPLPSSNFSTSVPDNDAFQRPPMPLPSGPPRQGSDTLPPVPKRREVPTSRTMSSTLATSTSSSRSYSGGSPPLPTHPEAVPNSPTSATMLPLPPVPRRQNSNHTK